MNKSVFLPPILISVLIFTGCVLDHSNPFDPKTTATAPGKIAFNYQDNVGRIGSDFVELKWNQSVDPDFYFYAICRSTSPLNLSNRILTESEKSAIVKELSATNSLGLYAWSQSNVIASKAPTFASIFSAVALFDNISQNAYTDSGLSRTTRYYYSIVVFKKNLTSFSASFEDFFETSPNIYAARTCDLRFSYVDIPGVIYDIDIDPVTRQIFASGYAWGVAKYHVGASATLGYDYFLARENIERAFYTNGYIWEPNCFMVSQHTNSDANMGRTKGFIYYTNNLFYVPDSYYYGFYEISNLLTVPATNKNNAANTRNPRWFNAGNGVDDYTSYCTYDKVRDRFWVVGDSLYYYRASTFTYLSYVYFPYTVRFNGIAIDSSQNIWLSDAENNYVYKVDPDLNIFYYGGLGSKYGLFNNIHDIAVDDQDNIYVADTGNNRIQKFDRNFNFLTSFDLIGQGGNKLEGPRGLKYYNGLLYVGCNRAIVEIPVR